jgi:hypothetical protein
MKILLRYFKEYTYYMKLYKNKLDNQFTQFLKNWITF